MAQALINFVFQFFLLAGLAGSFFLIFRPTGYFHIGHASAMLVAAYTASILSEAFELSTYWIASGSLLSGMLVGFSGFALYAYIPESEEKPLFVVIFSIGFYIIVQNLLSMFFGDQITRINLFDHLPSGLIRIQSAYFSTNQLYITIINLILVSAGAALWYLTSFGRRARAISDNRRLSALLGINIESTLLSLALLGSLGAAVSGLLVLGDSGVSPSSGLSLLIPAILAVVIGGNRGYLGAVLGAALVCAAQVSLDYTLGSKWADVALFTGFATILILRPSGILPVSARAEGE